jgi:hypothetical protein
MSQTKNNSKEGTKKNAKPEKEKLTLNLKGESLNSLVDSWFETTQQIAEMRAEMKDLTEAKKLYDEEIIEVMEAKNMDKHTTGSGTLELIKKEKKKTSASKKQLKEIFETAEEGAISSSKPIESCEYIFSMFPVEVSVRLKAAKSDIP